MGRFVWALIRAALQERCTHQTVKPESRPVFQVFSRVSSGLPDYITHIQFFCALVVVSPPVSRGRAVLVDVAAEDFKFDLVFIHRISAMGSDTPIGTGPNKRSKSSSPARRK